MSLGTGEAAPAVVVAELTVAYGPTIVLDRLNLTVPAGSGLALVGANGAGKSTLLRCVGGMQQLTSGDIRVFGEVPGKSVDFWRRVATTVESPAWYHGLTVREHLDLVRVASGAPAEEGSVDELCREFGLAGLGGSLPSTLSAGERQRLLLAAVFVRPSRLLLLDEPEQHLDWEVKQVVAAHLATYVAIGGTVILASHDRAFIDRAGATVFRLGERER